MFVFGSQNIQKSYGPIEKHTNEKHGGVRFQSFKYISVTPRIATWHMVAFIRGASDCDCQIPD